MRLCGCALRPRKIVARQPVRVPGAPFEGCGLVVAHAWLEVPPRRRALRSTGWEEGV